MQRFFLLVCVLLGDWKNQRLALLTIFSGFPNNRHNSLWWTSGRQKALLCEGRQPSLLDADLLWQQQAEHRSKCSSLQAGGTLGEAPQSWACEGPWGEASGAHIGVHGWYLLHAGVGLAVLTRSSSQQSLQRTAAAQCSHYPMAATATH